MDVTMVFLAHTYIVKSMIFEILIKLTDAFLFVKPKFH